MNSIVLVGRLTRDPELRYVASGDPVVNFAIAVERAYRNADGEREVDFIDVVAWRKLAENTAKYTGKGHLIGVRGRLQIRSYQTQDGQKRKVAEVVADTVRFLGAPRNGNETAVHAPASAAEAAVESEGNLAGTFGSGSDDVDF
jgi:single-strand DNA-binding protein